MGTGLIGGDAQGEFIIIPLGPEAEQAEQSDNLVGQPPEDVKQKLRRAK